MQNNNIVDIIKARKSYFPPQFDANKKIPDARIKALLETANYAPSHKRTEPWRFIVFSGEQVKAFYKNMLELFKQSNEDSSSVELKKRKWEMKAETVSHVIAVYMKRDEKHSVPRCEEEWAVACAVQNILLSASHFEIAGYWGTGELAYSEEMKKFLQIGNEDCCMGFLQFGILKEEVKMIEKKALTDIDEKVFWR